MLIHEQLKALREHVDHAVWEEARRRACERESQRQMAES